MLQPFAKDSSGLAVTRRTINRTIFIDAIRKNCRLSPVPSGAPTGSWLRWGGRKTEKVKQFNRTFLYNGSQPAKIGNEPCEQAGR